MLIIYSKFPKGFQCDFKQQNFRPTSMDKNSERHIPEE